MSNSFYNFISYNYETNHICILKTKIIVVVKNENSN